MELDTGAGVSIVSEQAWSDKLQRPELQPCSLKLQSYQSKPLDVLVLHRCTNYDSKYY